MRLLYVFGAGFPHHVLTSTVLPFSDRPLYPMYLGRTSPYGVAPLIDQQYAGGVMAAGWFLARLPMPITQETHDTPRGSGSRQ